MEGLFPPLRSYPLATSTATTTDPVPAGSADPRASSRVAMALAWVGMLTLLTGVLAILVLHVIPPTDAISAYRRTISEYAYTTLGWAFNAGVLAVSAGSVLITVSLWLSRTLRRTSVSGPLMLLWSAALVVLVVFPKHDWSVGPSGHGAIHRMASLVAFVSVPIAVILIGRHRAGSLRSPGRTAAVSGIIAAGWLSLILGAYLFGPLSRTPWWLVFPLGLVERGVAFFSVAAVLSLGMLSIRAARQG